MHSVQISKYSSLRFVCLFLIMNCAGYLNSEDLLFSSVLLIFTVNKFLKVSKRCNSRTLGTLLLRSCETHISTGNMQKFYLRVELVPQLDLHRIIFKITIWTVLRIYHNTNEDNV